MEPGGDRQKHLLVERVIGRFGEDLSGRTFALWGLAFKPNTDDMREAPSRVIVAELLRRGAMVVAHDPVAMDEARRVFADLPEGRVTYAPTPMDAIEGADALVIVTEWRHFRSPDFERIADKLRTPLVVDGRNLFDPELLSGFGLEYQPVGRAARAQPVAA